MKKVSITRNFYYLLVTAFFISCVGILTSSAQQNAIGQLKLLGEFDIPHNQPFKGTAIGGLSGIDYDAANDLYYLISDDRSAINAARFYTAKLFCSEKGIDSVNWISVVPLLQANGAYYPNSKQDPAHTPDPEAIRYNARAKQLVWTSEGERIIRGKDTILENPAITSISIAGKYIDTFPLPENLLMRATDKGPRQNGVLEGLCFDKDFRTMYVNVEEPLFEDGPRADLEPNDAWIRIYRYDVASKKNTAQFAYQLDPIAHASTPKDAFKVNGVPDIYAMGNNQLMVLERSFSTGRLACTVKVFLADLNKADDIANVVSLKAAPPKKPVTKKLLLDMDALGIYIDNVEGVTYGPRLPNGHQTLVFVSDNNFMALEKTQFFLFEILP